MDTHSGAIAESFREDLLIKSRNQNMFEKFKLNRNLQTIPFKMMYNMSMLRRRFSNERRGGGGRALNHLPLLFCKSVCICIYREMQASSRKCKDPPYPNETVPWEQIILSGNCNISKSSWRYFLANRSSV